MILLNGLPIFLRVFLHHITPLKKEKDAYSIYREDRIMIEVKVVLQTNIVVFPGILARSKMIREPLCQ